ncbi:hypothetical protein HK104_007527, partial [Borealophlyctis nickersoniae]
MRISEFFRDFDKLRSYSIPRPEFVRGMNRIGCPMSEQEYEAVADVYADAERKGCCRWKDFERDIDRVFGETHLETRPSLVPPPAPMQMYPFPTGQPLDPAESLMLQSILNKIRDHLSLRQSSIKPFFKDFDKLCTGHVTKTQFRQCLTFIQCNVTDQEFKVLSKRYTNPPLPTTAGGGAIAYGTAASTTPGAEKDYIKDGGERICYLTFLKEMEGGVGSGIGGGTRTVVYHQQPQPQQQQLVQTQRREPTFVYESGEFVGVEQAPGGGGKPGMYVSSSGRVLPLTDSETHKLMLRLKTKVKTERIRVVDFMSDFDHLRHGKITHNEFKRGLKVLFTNLTE